MYFILRSAFWIGIITLLLPIGGETGFKTTDAVEAARSAVADLSGFCERNPATCETSGQAVSALGFKMAEGARWAYAMVSDEDYVPATRQPQTRTVRTVPFTAQGFAERAEQVVSNGMPASSNVTRIIPTDVPNTTILQRGTLTPVDHAPAWQGGRRI